MGNFCSILPHMTKVSTRLGIPKNPVERRAWIIYQLHIRGLSLRGLAREEGVSQQAMSACLIGPNSHLEPLIANAIGLTPVQLFPERFSRSGVRLGWTRLQNRKDSASGPNSQRQKGTAA